MRVPILILCTFLCVSIHAQKDPVDHLTGIASFYSNKFEGRKCSSGDIFRQNELTAAHKTLKFGTRVKVTNLKNDSIVTVKINDRMPRNSRRSIDLTLRAAKQLNFVKAGLVKVRMEILKDSLP